MGETEQCRERVYRGIWDGKTPCTRKPWKDGWCKQHHPDTKAAKSTRRGAKYQMECAAREKMRRLTGLKEAVLQAAEAWRDKPCTDDETEVADLVDAIDDLREALT